MWKSTWRNEANCGRKWLSRRGGCVLKKRCGTVGGLLRRRGLAGGLGYLGSRGGLGRCGLEVLKSFEGTEEHAVSSIDVPLNASKRIESGVERVAEWGIALDGRVNEFGAGEGLVEDVDAVSPELGFDAAKAPLDPFGRDKGVDERWDRRVGSDGGIVR
jgi:hypothetical protein